MARLGFVTERARPALTDDDALVAAHLPADLRLVAVPWDGDATLADECETLVLRSCWNYHLHGARFADWLTARVAAGTIILNPPDLVRWNTEKTYLRTLATAGCAVTPTHWLEGGATADLGSILASRGWRRAVVKPTVSASSFHTWVVEGDATAEDDRRLAEVLAHSGAMVQPFLDEIVTEGEWSLLFFDGAFSHAVLKRPSREEFRVQEEYGGTSTPTTPPAALVDDAAGVLAALPEAPVYARIDGVQRDGRLLLVEAELIEPALFLGLDPDAPARFAAAIVRRIEAAD